MGEEAGPERQAELEARVLRLEQQVALLTQELLMRSASPVAELRQTGQRAAPPPPHAAYPEAAAGAIPGPTTPYAGSTPVFAQAESSTESRLSLEDRLGSQWFNRLAIVLLLIGTAYGLKLAVDRGWIGPVGRVIAGLIAGAGLVLWSERFRRNGFGAFSYSLKAVGTGVLYLALWAGFRMYGLLPAGVALGLMVLVTAWNAFMAWAQDAELLAAYALIGAFATPVLLSTGGNHEVFLFTYLLAVDLATVVLVRLKGWPRLLTGAFPLTVMYFIGWYVQHWSAEQLAVTSLFVVLFDATFSSMPLHLRAAASRAAGRRSTLIEQILLPPANAAFAVLAFYSVLQDSGHHALVPWMVVLYGAIYLAFLQLPQSRTARAMHLSIAVVLLTIAIPLKASGHWITVGWLMEGLALVWVASRLASAEPSHSMQTSVDDASIDATGVLRGLGAGALALGFMAVVFHVLGRDAHTLWNGDTATALLAIAAFAGAAWLAPGSSARVSRLRAGGILAIAATAALLSLRELVWWGAVAPHRPLQSADFGDAVLALAVFTGVIAVALRVLKGQDAPQAFWMMVAGYTTVAFNAVSVLTGVREISSMWGATAAGTGVDAALKQALAISGFLMAYGAVLLAAGFWRRSAFLRWQGLLLLLFTILKAFLYDMRNLSQGYRVVSFLALGALLMAVSFAYQKDWLALRSPAEGASSSATARNETNAEKQGN